MFLTLKKFSYSYNWNKSEIVICDIIVSSETNPNWAKEIRDDVIEECNKHGGVLHVYVDQASPQGNVYVKCPSIATAVAAVNSLHGRWFAGRVITAAYVPVVNYHSLFPDAMTALQLLVPSAPRRGMWWSWTSKRASEQQSSSTNM